ncbi:TonB-dependent receptor [Allosphingosinicella indica]|uniref:Iron complex outermembrane recepter protein n=1 Tax=Allosphingosinicella indica TaxID=941907 RepID=A0A1X7GIM8_9SPHN|nr:TonB-dependent receptor [Allosphingosinicella indica]SMF70376.1 iron complex outermembrane recepter protein [Allosphingosinicella indica]
MRAHHDRPFAIARLATAVSLMAIAAPAWAQTGTGAAGAGPGVIDNQDIIVTATKRASTIQDVPFSINAQTQEDIQKSGSNTIEDLSRNVAGLAIQNLGPGQSQVSIRGVSAGQVVRDQPGVKEQVGVYLDESVVSLSLFTPDLDLFDLNRVETLRGPQGTLFGSGSVGGTIRYITNQPTTERVEGTIEGNLNLVNGDDLGGYIKGAINAPLNDSAAVRVVGYHTEYGGFVNALKNDGTIDTDVNGGRRTGGRIAFMLQPAENVTITPRLVYQEIRANGYNRQEVYNLFANPFTTTRPPVTFRERQQFLLTDESFQDNFLLADLTADVDFGAVGLTSVTSYIDRRIRTRRDASALTGSVSVDLGFPDAAVLLPSGLVDATALETFTQELRLASTGPGPFQWLVGGFYSKIDRFYKQRLPTPGYDAFTDATLGAGTAAAVSNGFGPDSPYNSDLPYDIEQKAVFGEASYSFGQFTLTAGARYYDFEEERSFTSGGLFSNGDRRTDTTGSNGVTPRFLASYKASENITLNLQASKGFRLGGVNDPLNLPLCSPGDAAIFGGFQSYDDESLWNYEGGVKSQFGGITFNTAAFYTDIKNLQVTLDAGTCSSRIVFNVPKAHTAGVEVEFAARLLEGFDVSVNGSYVSSKFDSTVADATGAVIGGIRDGNRLPSVPKFQMAANASYTFPIGPGSDAFIAASFQHVGSRYTQPSDQENPIRSFVSGLPFGGATGLEATVIDLKLPDYQLVNFSVGVEMESGLDITAYVNNVFDENPLLSFDRERGGRARLGFNIGQPRTYGVTVRKSF